MNNEQPFDTPANAAARTDGAFRGRRIRWETLWALRPDLRPDNDNRRQAEAA
jgi:hypothetical protein